MSDDELLSLLRTKEDNAGHYVWGQLGQEREQSLREYHRMAYGNEEDGWSDVVTSDIQDSIEWLLPALLKVFTSTDKAVCFEPATSADIEGAEQATEAVSYVFYRQNNGFLILYTAIKDALTVRNCAVMWRKERVNSIKSVPFKDATPEMIAMLLQEAGKDAEVTDVVPKQAMMPHEMTGQPVPVVDPTTGEPVTTYSGRIKQTETLTKIKVEAFAPQDLLVDANWTSPLLAECPYVCRMIRVTVTDLEMMGYKDVTAEELRDETIATGGGTRLELITQSINTQTLLRPQTTDDSMAEGWLRMEWVLVDQDGDGVAERRQIVRLKNRILSSEVVGHVPLATFSPILNPHRWDGMSIRDVTSDIQKTHTELLRQTLNSLYLSNNPRKKVMTDANWVPYANVDDLLDSRPGGLIRQRQSDAVTDDITPFVGQQTLPVLEYIQGMRENRTGVSRTSMGLNPDSLNNTATGRQLDMSAAGQRIELIARICAEVLLKPIMLGILKLLTDGDMDKMMFRLRDKFVEYDPQSWRDQYDMVINVGLGTGDKAAQAASLQTVMQSQMALMQYGLVTPKHLYHTETKIIENAGFKDVENFVQQWTPPDPNAPKQPPLPIQVEQIKGQVAMAAKQRENELADQLHQREMQRDILIENNRQEAQARDTQHTAELEAKKDALKGLLAAKEAERQREFEAWRETVKAQTAIYLKQLELSQADEQADEAAGEDPTADAAEDAAMQKQALAASLDALHQIIGSINQPKMIIKDQMGRPIGIGPMAQESL